MKRLLPLLAIVLLCGCRNTQTVSNSHNTATTFTPQNYIQTITSQESTQLNLTAKAKVSITINNRTITTNGNLRMRRGEVIQLSLQDPLLGVAEVGRLEFRPDRVVILDRMNHRYVSDSYSNVSFLQRANVDFLTIQALFWNQLFQPGKHTVDHNLFAYTTPLDPQHNITATYTDHNFRYNFLTTQPLHHLTQTTIHPTNTSSTQFSFDYSDFTTFENKPFPQQMLMTFQLNGRQATLQLHLSSLRSDNSWNSQTDIPSRYNKVSAEQILNALNF